ncbi:hypothetical protein [Mucilaginibacter sp.]|uniref:hypothetical protein n=1 Tax=Mucilaginibacter sp. TaxID=1882438 RepID=UPI0028400810|nr:hypothetical protein [Mucilaginibacter sp.]MDR3693947.1 hypothetical protein [Mucilaginibacter sp.]
MTGLLIFGLTLIAVIGYVLFAPFFLEINSFNNFYGIRFLYLASANLILIDDRLKINIKAVGWHRLMDPFAKSKKAETKPVKQKKEKKSNFSLPLVKALLKTFKIKKCFLDIDTGDVQVNGILYPIAYWLGTCTAKPISINFLHHNEINLEIENNMARLIKAYIYSSIKTKNHGKLK